MLRPPVVSVTVLLWLATTVFVVVGNLRVVDDLVVARQAGTPTSSVPIIGNRRACGAAAASVLVPLWIIPDAGVILIAAPMMWRSVRSGHGGQRELGTE